MSEIIDHSLSQNISIRKVHEPVGYCIYCSDTKSDLTDEHTIPDGMGGRHILPQASCKKCQAIINVFEQYCMRTMLANTRAHLRIKSSKKRPEPTRSIRVRKRDGTIARVHKPINQLPIMTNLPVWPEPYALRELDPPVSWPGFQWVHQPFDMEQVLIDFDAAALLTEYIEPSKFVRMLAKIAHAHSIAIIGKDYFKPWLPEIILRENGPYIHLVGGSLELEPKDRSQTMFVSFATRLRTTDGMPLGVFSIRLFPNLGGPTYRVIIGEMLKPWPLP